MSVGQWIVFWNGVAKAVSRSNFRGSFRGKDWRLHGACTLMIVVVVRRASDDVPGTGRLEPITATLLSHIVDQDKETASDSGRCFGVVWRCAHVVASSHVSMHV